MVSSRAVTWGRRRRRGSSAILPTLHDDGSGPLLRPIGPVTSPVLQVILERARTGSRPRDRHDEHTVCLAIEGGGMRGAVSAGMCVVLETAGLVGAFDRIYGVSAGALNACTTATGQAALGATHYQDAARRRVVNPLRPLVRQPMIDFDLLFEDVIAARKPLAFDRLATGPEFRALATSLENLALRVLGDFADAAELMQAVRVSAALPALGGDAPAFRGERMIDGGLVEPIPVEAALAEGASHVMVLRSRPLGYRKSAYAGLGDSLAVRSDRRLSELIKSGHVTYNRQAAWLERSAGGNVLQIAVPEDRSGISRLRADAAGIAEALRLGAKAMASAVLADPIDLCWQPVVCRASDLELGIERQLAASG